MTSDTTAATITGLVFELCKDQDALRKLQAEIDEFYSEKRNGKKNVVDDDGDGSVAKYEGLQGLKYLMGCINEALRLHVRPSTSLTPIRATAVAITPCKQEGIRRSVWLIHCNGNPIAGDS